MVRAAWCAWWQPPGGNCLPAYVCAVSRQSCAWQQPESADRGRGCLTGTAKFKDTAVCLAWGCSGPQATCGCLLVCLCRSRLAFSKLVLPADSRAAQMQYQHLAAAGQGGLQVEGLPGQQGLPGEAEAQQMAWEPEAPPTGRRRKQRTTQGALAPLQVGCKLTYRSVRALRAVRLEPAAAGRHIEQRAAQGYPGTPSGGFCNPASYVTQSTTPLQASGASRGGRHRLNSSVTPWC